MSNQKVIHTDEFDLKNITFSTPITKRHGGRGVQVKHSSGEQIFLQLPAVNAPFGISEYQCKDSFGKVIPDVFSYSLSLSFYGLDTNDRLKKARDTFNNIDQLVMEEAQKNSYQWLKIKDADMKQLIVLFTPTIKQSLDENGELDNKYADKIRLKVYKSRNSDQFFNVTAFKKNNGQWTEVDARDHLTKGSTVVPIVKLQEIWIAGGKFGITWVLSQIKILPSKKLVGYAFVNDPAVDASEESDDDKNSNEESANESIHTDTKDTDTDTDTDTANELISIPNKIKVIKINSA